MHRDLQCASSGSTSMRRAPACAGISHVCPKLEKHLMTCRAFNFRGTAQSTFKMRRFFVAHVPARARTRQASDSAPGELAGGKARCLLYFFRVPEWSANWKLQDATRSILCLGWWKREKTRFADCGAVYTCFYWNQALRATHLVICLFETYLPSASEYFRVQVSVLVAEADQDLLFA